MQDCFFSVVKIKSWLSDCTAEILFATYMSIILWWNYWSQQLISLLPQTSFKWTGIFINHILAASGTGLINTWKGYLNTFQLQTTKRENVWIEKKTVECEVEGVLETDIEVWCNSALGLCQSLRVKDHLLVPFHPTLSQCLRVKGSLCAKHQ